MGVRERVGRFGLKIVCLACKGYGRHRTEDGTLGSRVCPRCGTPGSMRPLWWIRKYPELARAEVGVAVRLMGTLDAHGR